MAPLLGDPLQLLDRLVHPREADDRRGVDRVGVVERPVLEHPLVERVDDRARGIGVVGEALFDHAGERGPHERAVDAHVLHEREARLGVEEGVDGPA